MFLSLEGQKPGCYRPHLQGHLAGVGGISLRDRDLGTINLISLH